MYQKLPNEERPVVETEPRDLSYFRICDQVGYSAAHDSWAAALRRERHYSTATAVKSLRVTTTKRTADKRLGGLWSARFFLAHSIPS